MLSKKSGKKTHYSYNTWTNKISLKPSKALECKKYASQLSLKHKIGRYIRMLKSINEAKYWKMKTSEDKEHFYHFVFLFWFCKNASLYICWYFEPHFFLNRYTEKKLLLS